jgi:TatD DNase family protein
MSEEKINFFDSHAHYYDDRFYGDENPQGAEKLLDELFEDGLLGVINVGTNHRSNLRAIEQAKKYPLMYVAAGIHPEDVASTDIGVEGELSALYALLEDRAKREENKIVALGEIGLDYYWEPYDRGQQIACFEAQMEMARSLGLPVVIHDREAHGDSFDVVCKYPDVRGVFHSYSGSAEMAKELVKRGWYISFSGVVSFNLMHSGSAEVSDYYDSRGIATRAGLHCAPLIHASLGTLDRGAVRVSPNFPNTVREVERFLSVTEDALKILKKRGTLYE